MLCSLFTLPGLCFLSFAPCCQGISSPSRTLLPFARNDDGVGGGTIVRLRRAACTTPRSARHCEARARWHCAQGRRSNPPAMERGHRTSTPSATEWSRVNALFLFTLPGLCFLSCAPCCQGIASPRRTWLPFARNDDGVGRGTIVRLRRAACTSPRRARHCE